ncbi:MAG: hypothetical protein LBV09_05780 [Deferribacteraceae bacterium]|jgi:hypothetical protein|nr:hypothetical protein [Deferribacteraceae bacterium]
MQITTVSPVYSTYAPTAKIAALSISTYSAKDEQIVKSSTAPTVGDFLEDKPLIAYRYQRLLERSPEKAELFITAQRDLDCYDTDQTTPADEFFFTQLKKQHPNMAHTADGFRQALNSTMSAYYSTVDREKTPVADSMLPLILQSMTAEDDELGVIHRGAKNVTNDDGSISKLYLEMNSEQWVSREELLDSFDKQYLKDNNINTGMVGFIAPNGGEIVSINGVNAIRSLTPVGEGYTTDGYVDLDNKVVVYPEKSGTTDTIYGENWAKQHDIGGLGYITLLDTYKYGEIPNTPLLPSLKPGESGIEALSNALQKSLQDRLEYFDLSYRPFI